MRIPNSTHLAQPWRIHDLVPDFTLEDVWALPISGDAGDFDRFIGLMVSGDETLLAQAGLPARLLWELRDRLGAWFDLGRIKVAVPGPGLPIPGTASARWGSGCPVISAAPPTTCASRASRCDPCSGRPTSSPPSSPTAPCTA